MMCKFKDEIKKHALAEGVSINDLSKRIARYRSFLSNVFRGYVLFYEDHAKKLASYFPGTTPIYWLGLYNASNIPKQARKPQKIKFVGGTKCPKCGCNTVKKLVTTMVCVDGVIPGTKKECNYLEDKAYNKRVAMQMQSELVGRMDEVL